ncbi:MAG TPA: GerMN domain-containing protein [Pyrinomonadaceae bacterium]|nr:GerMN domain-containing protein [Pyrinomonadaceae bacterium]
MKRKAAFLFLVLGLAGLLAASDARSIEASGKPKTRKVKVYFYHDPGEYIDLSPVERRVNAVSPARAAINALLKGPTEAERQKGFDDLAGTEELAIGSLRISRGTARVNFVASRAWHGWPGDLGPVRFKKAVELTLKQFPNVQTVIVSVNGERNFEQ